MRTMDPRILNEVANLEVVRPSLGGSGPIDMTDLINDPNNYTFVSEYGGFLLVRIFDGVWECHTILTPDWQKSVVRLMENVARYMFTETSCQELVTKVPDGNRTAAWLARHMQFKQMYRREGSFAPGVGISYQSLPLDRWARACSTVAQAGREFHEKLEAAKVAHGSELLAHPDDEVHDSMVGAALLMAIEGNVVKGVNFYNRWAVFAGYRPLFLVSEQPPVVDIVDAIVGVIHGKLEIIQCR